jgi:hypothetical protein
MEARAMSAEPTQDWVATHERSTDALRMLVEWMDTDLDGEVADTYKGQPLAQDWARVAKVAEEAGEAVDALIGVTGQNPRKGHYGSVDDLLTELADVALTGLYAIQLFTKNGEHTIAVLFDRARHHRARREAQLESVVSGERRASDGGPIGPSRNNP